MAIAPIGHVVSEMSRIRKAVPDLAKKIFKIINDQSRHSKLLKEQEAKITTLHEAILRLEASDDVLLARAGQMAAQTAALTITYQARQVGQIEARGTSATFLERSAPPL
jgi:hypothetical protein